MNYNIRKKEKEDCFKVHHATVTAWNETYKGLIPEDYLENMKLNEEKTAKSIYDKYDEKEHTTFVLEVDNNIVGFAKYGICSEENIDNCGEVYALYILKDYQGYGLGKKLIEECIKELKKLNCNKMVISCLKGNPSNEFYKHIGGKKIKEKIYKKLNLPEIIYEFDI